MPEMNGYDAASADVRIDRVGAEKMETNRMEETQESRFRPAGILRHGAAISSAEISMRHHRSVEPRRKNAPGTCSTHHVRPIAFSI